MEADRRPGDDGREGKDRLELISCNYMISRNPESRIKNGEERGIALLLYSGF
jgi:hypothetical protein